MRVNNLELPHKLAQFLEASEWLDFSKKPNFTRVSSSPYAEEIEFLGLEGIIDLTNNFLEIGKSPERDYYGLVNDASAVEIRNGLLAPSLAVFIASNNEEEVICLDYSMGKKNPRVMLNNFEQGLCRWIQIARDFDNLLFKIL